jgi:translocation and assembly module TamB
MRGVPLTPEQRAARNAARRALARRVAWRSALASLALVGLLALLAWWLLTTVGGRDVLLRQIVARLPQGTTLTWRHASGPASGPMTLQGVRFTMPRAPDPACIRTATQPCAAGTIVFTARTIVLDPALRPLLGRSLRLDALDIAGATLDLPVGTQPFKLPRWPDSLPDIAPPLALRADSIRIDGLRVTRDHRPLVSIRQARGGLRASRGRLHLERLVVDSDRGRFSAHGDYAPADAYRTDMTATAVLAATGTRMPARVALVARGDLDAMDVAIAGAAPAPLQLRLVLRGRALPRWSMRARSTALDPALLAGATPSTPLAIDLRADGHGGNATLRGHLARGALDVAIQPSQVRLDNQVLRVQPLVLDVLQGRVTLRGQVDMRDPRHGSLRIAANARGMTWGAATGTALRADTDLGIAGSLDAWAAIGRATVRRGARTAAMQLDGRGNRDRMALRSLRVAMPEGRLDATGTLRWSPTLQWDLQATLAGFDPGYLFAGWDGALQGRITSTGNTRAGGGFNAQVQVPALAGRLRGRALQAHAALGVQGNAYAGDVVMALGDSRIAAHGTVADAIDVTARFSPLQLGDLLPRATGSLRGNLRVTGARRAPDIDVDLDGQGLAYGAYRAGAMQAHGRLPWRGGSGALAIDARGLAAGVALERLHVDARGAVEDLRLQVQAAGAVGAVDLAGSAGKRVAGWSGAVDRLHLAPARGPAWRLQAPIRFAQDGARWTLSHGCMVSAGAGSLCVRADWPAVGVDIDGHALPLMLASPYLPARSDGRPWLAHGEVDLDARLRSAGNHWQGSLHATSASGGLRNSEQSRHDLVGYTQLTLSTTFDAQHVDATLGAGLEGGGRIDARVRSGWDAYAPLSGSIVVDTDELTWTELLSPDIVDPTGHIRARLALGGTRAQPALGGQAQLSNFSTELPALAISLRNGTMRLDAQPDGSARLHGSVQSGDGTLALDGSLGWRAAPGASTAPLVLNVRGSNVLAADTRDLRAVIDPDVVVRYAPGRPLDISGRVGVPSARLDLERLDRGVASSPDVVVLDPVDSTQAIATPAVLDLTLALGKDVRLHGFGLDGTLAGDLRVRTRPGREMVANGSLDIGGQYLAYGRRLDIVRGRLSWSDTAIGDPLLDIRAQRQVSDVTAGIDVTGHATRPQAEVWTDPPSDQSEALAYLALGRPLSSASADESRQLGAASAALTAGGNLLASQLGARLGLETAGVSESRALGGSVLGIGKYLSPKLYVSYGVSLLGTGEVLTLKYLLRKGVDIEIESSTVENRASLNLRKEK